jgi:GAF domain-containing protein
VLVSADESPPVPPLADWLSLFDALLGAPDARALAAVAETRAAEMLGAAICRVLAREERGLRLVDGSGRSAGFYVPIEATFPACQVARTGEPLFISTREEMSRLCPHVALVPEAVEGWAVVPAPGLDGVPAIFTAGFSAQRIFGAEERERIQSVARQFGAAFERLALRREAGERSRLAFGAAAPPIADTAPSEAPCPPVAEADRPQAPGGRPPLRGAPP